MSVGTAVRGLSRYLREVTGEAKWDDYLERCRREEREPMTRRDFERHRAELREHTPQSRCC